MGNNLVSKKVPKFGWELLRSSLIILALVFQASVLHAKHPTPKSCSEAFSFFSNFVVPKHAYHSELDLNIKRRILRSFAEELDPFQILFLKSEVEEFVTYDVEKLNQIWHDLEEKGESRIFRDLRSKAIQRLEIHRFIFSDDALRKRSPVWAHMGTLDEYEVLKDFVDREKDFQQRVEAIATLQYSSAMKEGGSHQEGIERALSKIRRIFDRNARILSKFTLPLMFFKAHLQGLDPASDIDEELDFARPKEIVSGDLRSTSGGEIAVIKIAAFEYGVADQFEQKLNELKKGRKIRGIILDLRNNLGGFVAEGLQLLSRFFSVDPAYYEVERERGAARVKATRTRFRFFTLQEPVVILVNEKSASTSEIVALAFQDYGRGIVVGPPHTYGKGTLHRPHRFDDGTTFTISDSLWLGPNKTSIAMTGVESDIVLRDQRKGMTFLEKYPDFIVPRPQLVGAGNAISLNARVRNQERLQYLRKQSQDRLSVDPILLSNREQVILEREVLEATSILDDLIDFQESKRGR